MTDDSNTKARLAALAARRDNADRPTPRMEPNTSPRSRNRVRRRASASRWFVAALSAASGFGLVAAMSAANNDTVQTNAVAVNQTASRQPIIVVNVSQPVTPEQAAAVAAEAIEQLPAGATPGPQAVTPEVVTTTEAS